MPHPLTHGIDTYFREFFGNRRRVAVVLLIVSAALGTLIAVAGRRASNLLDDPKRFGFEGPKQWVERIRLEEIAEQESPGLFQITYLTAESRKGGRKPRHVSTHPQAEPELTKVVGIGEDEVDLLAKARMLALDGPVIRSEELVIERLVRPDYPEEARDKNIEGVVELVALVDTTGSVEQIQIVGGTREPMLEHAAARAILECRYRPYRVRDEARRVWAAFRIAFSLY
ncbi:MAG TPA: energy transducer TonB [Methylomirabilota bacterium]|jgi:TonB family protein|nr:energy transducer TonB [Methylomirabilota bacterium]